MDAFGKMALLVGSGFSKQAGLPTSVELCKVVYDNLNPIPEGKPSKRTIKIGESMIRAASTIIGSLRLQSAHNHCAPFADVDIEAVVSCLEILAGRRPHAVEALIGSWHPMIQRLDRSVNYQKLHEEVLLEIKWALRVANEESNIGYLDPLASLLQRLDGPLEIFSLNYDNLIEFWAERRGIRVWRGFDGEFSGTLDFPHEPGIHLSKLHGSIDWMEVEKSPDEAFKWRTVSCVDMNASNFDRILPAIICGQDNKLNPKGPYLDLFMNFVARLEGIQTLIVSGYSFRDEHVNTYIGRWLIRDPARRVLVFNGEGTLIEKLFVHALGEFAVAANRGQLVECNADAAGAVTCLNSGTIPASAELVPGNVREFLS